MRIFIIGDSFAYGHGCDDRIYYYDTKSQTFVGDKTFFFEVGKQSPSAYCYSALLQKEYPTHTVTNKSYPGADNMSIYNILLNHIDDADLIFYNLSTYTRMQVQVEDGSEIPGSWVLGQHEWNPGSHSPDYYKAHEYFLKYLYQEEWFLNITSSAIYGAYGLAKAKNKKFYWSAPYVSDWRWVRTNKLYPSWVEKFKPIDYCRFDSLNDFHFPGHENNTHSEYLCPDQHANNLGHEYYYENIIKPIILKEIPL